MCDFLQQILRISKKCSTFAGDLCMKLNWVHSILLAWLIVGVPVNAASTDTSGQAATPKKPNKALAFFFRVGEKMDRFQLNGLDTSYIALPEHSWRVALTNGEVGLNTTYTTFASANTHMDLHAQSAPSLELGFNASYRGLGGGYSWDVLSAYTTNWNISLGGKAVGLEFIRNVSSNLRGTFSINDEVQDFLPPLEKGDIKVANTSLSAWYVLNAAHYSHNAAIKQSYIQKRSAGSLLLSVAYMSTSMSILDSTKYIHDLDASVFFDGVTGMVTRQVAIGIGYGINYTPNKGKVLLHASANMQVVCYSINHIFYDPPEDAYLPGIPQYEMHPDKPAHVTGNMRAAISWEINKWVHLSVWAQANNQRFTSNGDLSRILTSQWLWQAHLNIGVRFGAGKKKVREVMGEPDIPIETDMPEKKAKLPKWLREYFFSLSEK